jgi:hypothetical protein
VSSTPTAAASSPTTTEPGRPACQGQSTAPCFTTASSVAPGGSTRDRVTGRATLVVNHLERLTRRPTATLAAEGRRLLRFVAAVADAHDVRFVAVD